MRAVLLWLLLGTVGFGQKVVVLSPGMARSEGVDAGTGTAYTRVYLNAKVEAATFDLARPTLTVQCTKRANGKFGFEMLVNDGGVTDAAFYPPWKSSEGNLYPPVTEKVPVTMEFLGYTKVKPVKRQFEKVVAPAGQMRYNSPGGGSANLEEIAFYFQYLKDLPTLRLTYAGHAVTFETGPLLEQARKEALCKASGL